MKLIRMKKTMAGPAGVRHPGLKPFTVGDEEAAQLVAADAAEIIATIADATVIETTAVTGPPERTTVRQTKPKAKK